MEVKSIVEQPDREAADLRAGLHGMWAAVADGWAEHGDYVDTRGGQVTDRLLELSGPRPGDRVLELACGPGGTGLAAAERVGPGGEVVLSDVVAGMTAIAASRAEALRLDNVSTLELDLERIEQPDASYDVVLCREGLMFVPDPASAAREIRRVLRPGGRLALAVWGPRERNPWLGIVFDAVTAQLGTPMPPPSVPHPFSLDDSGELAEILSGAGLADVLVGEIPVPLLSASFDEWWTRTTALAGPLAKKLALLDEDGKEALRARALEAVKPFETAAGLEFPGVSLVASGRRD